MNTSLSGTCVVCDAQLNIPEGTIVDQVISCKDCSTRMVVKEVTPPTVVLIQAPAVEEDWGQ